MKIGRWLTFSDGSVQSTAPLYIATFEMLGTIAVKVGLARFYIERDSTILSVRASLGGAPTGSSALVDLNKSGTTIFTTQGNRPAVAASGFTSGLVTNMDVSALTAGEYLTCDVDQIGSTAPGTDLTVQVRYRHA